jgi:uncharacterized repeat protein (TIGR03803 family)
VRQPSTGSRAVYMAKLGLLEKACIVSTLCFATAIGSPAQTLTTLHSFDGTDGSGPNAALVQGTDGNFYGTTGGGGSDESCNAGNGCGTIFEITPSGTLTTLQSFNGTNGFETNGVVQGTDGKFYGTTRAGGSNESSEGGAGTFFSIVPGDTLVTLYNFCSLPGCADGTGPSGLVQGTDGNFYGTTPGYAAPDACSSTPCGTIFKITPSGTLTTLYTFGATVGTGWGPMAGLVQGSDGNFYGTTAYGGNECPGDQAVFCGTIFKITPAGALTQLYTFCAQPGCPDGSYPSGLVQGSDGDFYGAAAGGGAYGYGTVFKITPTGTFTTLHSFNGVDGQAGFGSGVLQGTDGNFYGTTSQGGVGSCPSDSYGCGTIFKMTPAGELITLYAFEGTATSGVFPNGLLQAANGFYGTTFAGGTSSDGMVFSFSIGIGGTTTSTTGLGLSPPSTAVGLPGPVVMTAAVAPSSGSGTPTGVVDFFNGSNEIGFANLNGGVATYSYNPSNLAVDTYQITAIYSGDGTFATSTSPAQTLTVSSSPPASTPAFSIPPGTYTSAQTVTITDTTTGATLYFTTDGTTPTTASDVYNGPITVSSTETINAIAAASGYSNSAVATAAYTISPSPDYQVSVTPSALTIVAGQSGTAKFTVTPSNGFSSQVGFACSGLPAGAACSFAPSSVTPSGGDPVTSTLTVTTTATNAALRRPMSSSHNTAYALLVVPCLGMIIGIATRRKRPHRGLRVFLMLTLVVLAACFTSCGSRNNAGNPGTPAGTSTITVMGSTSGPNAISQTATLEITITQ